MLINGSYGIRRKSHIFINVHGYGIRIRDTVNVRLFRKLHVAILPYPYTKPYREIQKMTSETMTIIHVIGEHISIHVGQVLKQDTSWEW